MSRIKNGVTILSLHKHLLNLGTMVRYPASTKWTFPIPTLDQRLQTFVMQHMTTIQFKYLCIGQRIQTYHTRHTTLETTKANIYNYQKLRKS